MDSTAAPRSSIDLRIRWEEDGCTVHVSGELDVSTEALLRDAVTAALEAAPAVTVDMSGVAFADCRGVAALVDCVEEGDRSGRPVVVRGWPRSVQRIASLLPDVAEAIDRGGDAVRPAAEAG